MFRSEGGSEKSWGIAQDLYLSETEKGWSLEDALETSSKGKIQQVIKNKRKMLIKEYLLLNNKRKRKKQGSLNHKTMI